MIYSLEKIYALVGRDDKVAVLSFQRDSEAYRNFGNEITVVFLYNQPEREHFEDKHRTNTNDTTHGRVKAKYLGNDLPEESVELLKREGVNSKDISSIFHSPFPYENVYHKEERRTIRKIILPIEKMPKGADYDWMYGFNKRLVKDGIGLCPYDRERYLAMKLFYEPGNILPEEFAEVWNNGIIYPAIEEKYLELKFEKEITTLEEEKRLEQLWQESIRRNMETFKQELNNAGISLKKLQMENPAVYYFLIKGTYQYIPRHLNIAGARAIYLDFKGFLHVFLRHVEEFKVSEQTKNKDNFLWDPEDVLMVIKNVITSVDEEVQAFWKKEPNQRFSKYGEQSFYFEGDYYTFHIEADGKLSTFHKNRKKLIEKHDSPNKKGKIEGGWRI